MRDPLPVTIMIVALLLCGAAKAETVRIARQLGLSYLPLILMQDRGLLEAEAKERGIDLQVEWLTFTSGIAINDALTSGTIDLGAGGATCMITMWNRTRDTLKVKGLAALGDMPIWLMTNKPALHSLADFTTRDRIALPATAVSTEAVVLQMAAMKAFGPGQQFRLDPLTVSMAHTDGERALLSGSAVTAHFTSAPFMYEEAADPRVHRLLDSYGVLGGSHTFNLVWTTARWHDAHPEVVAAFIAALDLAMAMIREDPLAAAKSYVHVEQARETPEQLAAVITRPEIDWTTTPNRMMVFARFMHSTNAIAHVPGRWNDLFFPGASALNGN